VAAFAIAFPMPELAPVRKIFFTIFEDEFGVARRISYLLGH
jgi:hypothetical protein